MDNSKDEGMEKDLSEEEGHYYPPTTEQFNPLIRFEVDVDLLPGETHTYQLSVRPTLNGYDYTGLEYVCI